MPAEWRDLARSWQVQHPGWEYRLWTDEANRAFVAGHYPELLATYDSYPYSIQRADVIRYCLLHYYGGVYVDLDVECLRPVDELVQRGGFLTVLEPDEQGAWLGRVVLLSNAFMASSPGHPFLSSVLDSLLQHAMPGLTHCDVLATTGPLMLDAAYRAYSGDDVGLLPSHVAFPFRAGTPELESLKRGEGESSALRQRLISTGTYAVHYWANSWVGTLAGELVNPNPSEVEGFIFLPGVDSPGNDIANVGRNIPAAAVACSQIKGAVAFNTDGFVKDRLLPVEQWRPMGRGAMDEGLYVRRPQPQPATLQRLPPRLVR